MGKIARITNDKKLLLANELIEGDKFSLSADGTLHAKELIEGEQLSLNGERLEVVELEEGYDFSSEGEGAIDFSLMPKHIDYVGKETTTIYFILPPAYVNSDISLYIEANIGMEGDSLSTVLLYLPINRNYFIRSKKYSYDPSSPDYLAVEETKPAGSEEDKYIISHSSNHVLTNNTPIELKAGDYFHLGLSKGAIISDVVFVTLTFRENNESGVTLFTQEWRLETTISQCYLTTAMVDYFGKADDGIELTAMRELRKHSGYKYQQMLNEYYADSPKIITGIEQSGDKDYYYNMIKSAVDSVVSLVNQEKWEQAEQTYLDLYTALKDKFIGGSDSG